MAHVPNQPEPSAEPSGPIGDFPVVGIGASSGGVPALLRFFEHLPADSGMAFIIMIMQQPPERESRLHGLLSQVTSMQIRQVTQRMPIEPGQIYVAPPAQELRWDGVFLQPSESSNGRIASIDLFFRALGDAHRHRSIGIIISGTGSDGVIGLMRIKEQGGTAIVQSPDEAVAETLPRHAIAAGAVDFVLQVDEMPARLRQLSALTGRNRLLSRGSDGAPLATGSESEFAGILGLLRVQTGHDFSHYRRATVLRRMERRMRVHGLSDLAAYHDFIHRHANEPGALLNDLLINVTNFFRDPEAFATLERDVVPLLFEDKTEQERVRVWIAGCATGEEVYSIAMLLIERAAELPEPPKIQIFATDTDERALAIARNGRYQDSISSDVTPSRLQRFFIKEAGGYRISREVRELVVFARHDLLKDPPFSRLDLISCRNLLIHLNRKAQRHVLELFRFALQPAGVLFLGRTESAETPSQLFTVLNSVSRLYRVAVTNSSRAVIPRPPLRVASAESSPSAREIERRKQVRIALQQSVVARSASPSVLINLAYDLVYLSERAGRFLSWPGGEPSFNLIQLVDPEFRAILRGALFEAAGNGRKVELRRQRFKCRDRVLHLKLIVQPVALPELGEDLMLVSFDELEEVFELIDRERLAGAPGPAVGQLEAELSQTRKQLQKTIEQYETQAEEITVTNEELQSMNEELWSTAEELGMSKEELQSVNQELQNKIAEVSSVNDDLENFIASTMIPAIFVDRALRVRRFTPRTLDLFNFIPTDLGRPLQDLAIRLEYDRLIQDTAEVMETLRTSEREIRSADGRWYIARIMPYQTAGRRIGGATLTFIDITARRRVEESLRESEARFRQIAESLPQFALVSRADGSPEYVNRRWTEYTGLDLAATADPAQLAAVFHPDEREAVLGSWTRAVAHDKEFEMEAQLQSRSGAFRWFLLRSVPVKDAAGRVLEWFGSFTDIHEQKQAALDAAFLADLGERIRLADNAEALTWEVSRAVGEQLQASRCFFNEVDEAADNWRVRHDYGPEPSIAGEHRLSAYPPGLLELARAGRVAVNRDTAQNPLTAAVQETLLNPYGIRAFVNIPFWSEGWWRANLVVCSDRVRDWTAREIALLELIAERTWNALEKLRLDAELRVNRERLSLALQAGKAGTFEWNIQSDVSVWSPEIKELYGFDGDLFEGTYQSWARQVVPEDLKVVEAGLQEAMAAGQSEYDYEFRALVLNGGQRWLAGRTRLEYDPDGRPLRMLGIQIDISEQKLAEAEIARLLAEEQRARAMAETATRLKDEFLSVVSHELRSPLNAINGWIKLLRGGQLSADEASKAMATIERNAQAQNRLIEDLLDVSRIIAGKLRMEMQLVDAHFIMGMALDTLRPTAVAKGVRLELLPAPLDIAFTADPNRLQQAIWNLLSNAVKFTPPGGRVSLRLGRVDDQLEISVSDTGIGIDPEFLPYVFDRFRQSDAPAQRLYGGLGLGLAIVRHIVELHGGEARAASEGEGRGATFTIRLPLTRRGAPAETQSTLGAEPIKLPETIAPRLQGLQVLVVDDESSNCEMLKVMLTGYGVSVTTAESTAEAIATLEHAPFDLLISDIAMPEEDGYELIRRLRKREAGLGRHLPAIALTAQARSEDRVRAMGAGFDSHVPKPVEPAELALVMATLVQQFGRGHRP
ncbi:MAG TPA: CheR family methyltransferase [Blastocatellia bacterium]|nr:CheR family methyltransferase [Blastocatellia bacterium]